MPELNKIVIQHQDSLLYLAEDEQWVADEHDALGFPASASAVMFCTQHKLEDVQIVLKFNRPGKFNGALTPAFAGNGQSRNSAGRGRARGLGTGGRSGN